MNRIILEEQELISHSLFRLDSRKSNHILKTLKSQIGDRLKAGLLNVSIGTAIIHSIDTENREVLIRYKAPFMAYEYFPPSKDLRPLRK